MDFTSFTPTPDLLTTVQAASNSVSTEPTVCVTHVNAHHNTTTLAAVLTFMAIIILCGSLGNILVILAVSQTKKLQTASNLFVANLSLCDLLFVTLVLPVNMYTYLADGWRFNINICRGIGFLGYALTGTTIMTITAIAWNRYKLVVDGKMYHVIFKRRNLALMLAITWLVPVAFLQPAVFGIWGHFNFIPTLSSCNLDLDNSSQTFKIFLLIVRAAIPCGLIIYFYTSIYVTTRASRLRLQKRSKDNKNTNNYNNDENDNDKFSNSNTSLDTPDAISPTNSATELHQKSTPEQQPNQKREMRLTRMMIAIFLVFVVSYFPCTISSAIDMTHVLSKTFHMFCQTSIFLGSAINPMLYGFMNSQFRTAYYNIIMCSMLRRKVLHATTTTATLISSSSRRKKVVKSSAVGDRGSMKIRPADSIAPYSLLHGRPSKKKIALEDGSSPTKALSPNKTNSLKSDMGNTHSAKLASISVAKLRSERI